MTLEPGRRTFLASAGETLLAAALRNGLPLPYGCRQGNCGTCKHVLVEGDVTQKSISPYAISNFERERGVLLLCSTYARGDVVLEAQWRTEQERDSLSIPPVRVPAEVGQVRSLPGNLVELRLRLARPLRFSAGQYVEIEVPGTTKRRPYFIASGPRPGLELEIVIRPVPGGAFSLVIPGLRPGDPLGLRGPYGPVPLQDVGRPVLMVAQDAGIAPILSILRWSSEAGFPSPIRLFYGARGADVPYVDELVAMNRRLPGLELLIPPAPGRAEKGANPGVVRLAQFVGSAVPDASVYDAYVCGPARMCDALHGLLLAKGIPEARIRTESLLPA